MCKSTDGPGRIAATLARPVLTPPRQALGDQVVSGAPADRAWRYVVGLVLVTLVGYWPSAAALGTVWANGAALLNHGYAVALISVALLVHHARRIPASIVAPSWLGFGALFACSSGWLLATVAEVVAVHTVMLPLVAFSAVYAAFGWRAAGRLAFPIFYIGVALPFWLDLQIVFQGLTTVVTSWLLGLLGIPALIEGDLVHVPAGTFRIAYGCSGVNFIVVSLALAALYGHLFYPSLRKRLQLFAVAFALALAINWIRVTSIIYIGNATDMQSDLVYDHIAYGWILYAVSLVPLVAFAQRMMPKDDSDPVNPGDDPAGEAAPPVSLLPVAAAVVCLAAAPLWAWAAGNQYPASAVAAVSLPTGVNGWQGPTAEPAAWRPRFNGASGEASGQYTAEAGTVWMYANIYLSQRQGRELIHFTNAVTGDLTVQRDGRLDVPGEGGARLPVRQVETNDNGRQWLIWYWYDVGGRRVTGDVEAKIRQAVATLLGHPEAGVTAVATRCVGACEVARDRLNQFLQDGGTAVTWQHSTQ